MLISSLHSRKWDINAAYKRFSDYLKFRKDYPDWVIHEHPKAYDDLLLKNVTTMLDGRDKHGRRVYYQTVCKIGPDNDLTIAELHQIHNSWFEMVIFEPETIVNGIVVILDFQE